MDAKLHFISGLPRSGSTLLAAILRQNPRFHAGMTSPVGALYNALLETMSGNREVSVFLTPEHKRTLLKGLFSGYYGDQGPERVIFDTNRMWTSRLSGLHQLFPEAKVICCVRNMAWIMDSLERIVRNNAFEYSRFFINESERATVYTRVETLAKHDRFVGFSWSALREAFYGEHAGKLLLVDYELLTRAPDKTLPLIYRFLGEEPFAHDFTQVAYDAPQFDAFLNTPGLHRVHGPVTFKPRPTILPPDLFQHFEGLNFWWDQSGSRASVITMQPASPRR